MYTNTGAFSTQSFRTLFKNATTRGKSKFINKQILESFQRYPDALKKYGKIYNNILQELKNYLSSK